MKLLLVDDDELDRIAVERVLQKPNLVKSIVHASTAVSALKLFDEQVFDLVLLDYRLPDMECLDILKKITSHESKHAAVVILTGIDDNEIIEKECIVAGAQDFLLKQELSPRHLTKALVHAQARHSLNQKLKETHARLKYLAENDPMTGLSNRHFFEEKLRLAILRAQRTEGNIGLLFLDIDNFKLINDSLGHDVGDQLLQQVANILQLVIRQGDIVCRLGGDEFAIIAHDIDTESSVGILAQRVLDSLSKPVMLSKAEHFISCSIGISTYPKCAQSAEDMLKFADLAMYHVKQHGKNGFHFYTEGLQERVLYKIDLEHQLRSGVFQSQLLQYFQPVIDAQNFNVCGAEMLLRWNHPTKGVLSPIDFLDDIKELGFLSAIDATSRRLACKQLAEWRLDEQVGDDFRLAINASEQSIKEENFQLSIKSDLDAAGLLGKNLSIEVTEGDLVSDFEKTSGILNQLKEFGVNVAIDDFGTGYSSLAYLKWLPASTLKVDRSFVKNVPESAVDCRVLKAMITMAKSLDLDVIVEGVETIEQARLCQQYGADMLQGYFFSKPLSAQDFAAFIAQHRSQLYS